MSKFERVFQELAAWHEDARDVTGSFLYQPFGIETSDTVNAITLYAILFVVLAVFYRMMRPAPRARARYNLSSRDFRRNS